MTQHVARCKRSLLVGLALIGLGVNPSATAAAASGETLTAPKVDSINTFDVPDTVVPKPISAKAQGGKLTLKLEPKSVSVISIEQ
jgi:alpha-L-arabinofuranosidase